MSLLMLLFLFLIPEPGLICLMAGMESFSGRSNLPRSPMAFGYFDVFASRLQTLTESFLTMRFGLNLDRTAFDPCGSRCSRVASRSPWIIGRSSPVSGSQSVTTVGCAGFVSLGFSPNSSQTTCMSALFDPVPVDQGLLS